MYVTDPSCSLNSLYTDAHVVFECYVVCCGVVWCGVVCNDCSDVYNVSISFHIVLCALLIVTLCIFLAIKLPFSLHINNLFSEKISFIKLTFTQGDNFINNKIIFCYSIQSLFYIKSLSYVFSIPGAGPNAPYF